MNPGLASIVTALTFSFRSRLAPQADIVPLRHRLNVLQWKAAYLRPRSPDLAVAAPADWRSALLIIKPVTGIHRHRQGFRHYGGWKSRYWGQPAK
jgi:hypothetical protein